MPTTELTIDKVETGIGRYKNAVRVHAQGQQYFTGRQNLVAALSDKQPGDKVTVTFFEGDNGPMISAVDGVEAQSAPSGNWGGGNSRAGGGGGWNKSKTPEPTVKGHKHGMVAAWTKDIAIALMAAGAKGGKTTNKAAFNMLLHIFELVEEAKD